VKTPINATMLVWLGTIAMVLSGLSCRRQAAHAVTLQWHASEGAQHYNIYRSSQPGMRGEKIGTSTEPFYRDSGVSGGTTYYYTVTAVNAGKESGSSDEIKAVVPP
jgi:fibronectin type 3 domain-containing protein